MSKLEELKRRIVILEEDNALLSKIKENEDAIEAERNALQLEVDELKKKLESAERSRQGNYEAWQQCKGELDQLHEVLDALPGSIPKRAEGSCQDRSVLTRLAAWLGSTK